MLASLCLPGTVQNPPAMTIVAAQGAPPVLSNSLVLPPFLILAISLLYLGTLVYFLARLGWLLHCTTSLLRGASPVSLGAEGDELWSRCRQVLMVKDARILKSHRVAGPVTIGLIHPVLLVPEGFVKECTSRDFLAALAHECAHMKRMDFQKNLFYEIVSLLIAFHPFTWIMKSQIAQTREMVCDDMATEKLIDSHTYTESLLRLVAMMSLTATVPTSNAIGIFDANILEKRIMMMKTKRQHLGSAVKYGLMITGALLLLAAAGGSGAMARSVETQSPAASVIPDTAKGQAPNLNCTYYGIVHYGIGNSKHRLVWYPGTCVYKKDSSDKYYCARNSDKTQSSLEIACEWKLRRAGLISEPQSPSQISDQTPYGQIYKIGKDVTAPVVLKSVEAKFPKSARTTKAQIIAPVIVGFVVDTEGMPRDVHIHQRAYNPDFGAEAIKAVKQYRFKPGMRQGKPVNVAIEIEVNFKTY
jgi:TonB family protein